MIEPNGALLEVFQLFEFAMEFISWIRGCVSDPTSSILINGAPIDWFSSNVSLIQGCPLSPFLFFLYSDILFRSLNEAAIRGKFKAFLAGNAGS